MVMGLEVAEHPGAETTETVKVPAVSTVILWVVRPFDQRLLFGLLLVKTTESPIQKVVGPLLVIKGVLGN
jgi:hypothetical protein